VTGSPAIQGHKLKQAKESEILEGSTRLLADVDDALSQETDEELNTGERGLKVDLCSAQAIGNESGGLGARTSCTAGDPCP
jgi:hypothetical protein